MTSNPKDLPKYSPGVLSLLPLYYVGWADSVLSPSEVSLVKEKIDSLPFLTKEDKKLLAEWSNPAAPPSPQLFRQWVLILRQATQNSTNSNIESLAQLGLEMAKKSATETENYNWYSEETKVALSSLEKALGLVSIESHRNIFADKDEALTLPDLDTIPAFPVRHLTDLLNGPYHKTKKRVKTILSDAVFHLQNERDKDKYRNLILTWTKMLADQGLGALAYDEAYGGKNDMGGYTAAFETIGGHDLSLAIKFGVHFGLFGGSVANLGTEYHHQKYLRDIGTLQLSGCFAMTETNHGSNVRGLETTATYDHQTKELIIHTPHEKAGKEYIGNALHGTMASVFAQLIVNGESHGVHAVLVPLREKIGSTLPGVRVEDCGYKLGLNGVDNGRIWFDQVRVPVQNLLNRFGDIDADGNYTSSITSPSKRFFTMLGTLVGGRVAVPKAGLSAAKVALTISIKYGLKRRQFGQNDQSKETLLLDYPSHQHRLMPLLAKAYALDFGLKYLTKRYVERTDDDIREIETLAAGLKSYTTWFTTAAIQECREACGGKGYLMENRFSDLKADTDIFTTFEGDNTVLMQLVAKGLLSEFRQEFHDGGYMAVARYITGRLTTAVTELNPYVVRKIDKDHLLDAEFHQSAFAYRERSLLISLGERMQKMIKKRMNPYDAYLRCQTHMLALADAFVERIVLEQFQKTIADCEIKTLKPILKQLCDLYALTSIEKNKGWYLEQDYMEGVKTKAIRRVIAKLCRDTRQHAGLLVDAFDIPDACIAAPIALEKD